MSISSKGADQTAWKGQAGIHLFLCMQENQLFLQKRVNIILKKQCCSQVEKHMTCDVMFVEVRKQLYWKFWPYVVCFFCIFLHYTKHCKSKQPFRELAHSSCNSNIFTLEENDRERPPFVLFVCLVLNDASTLVGHSRQKILN